tara:strand:+ start:690 stop:1094 length:405 start_codon:yes stop_codon:yes gene_type:complete
MKIKIKTKELARKLTNSKLKEIYGEEAVFEDNYDEFYGSKYRKEVMDDANKYFDYYYGKIKECIVYPFKEGETYYTIVKSGNRHDIQENVWDDISEEMYRSNPDIRFFKKESVALMYMVQHRNDEQVKMLKKDE